MPLYCIKDPDRTLILYGTRHEKHEQEAHAYFRFRIDICNEETR
jgi:hypothetical protein